MVISDKQELRRCVKQAVRRAQICEAELTFDVMRDEPGILAMLDTWARPAASPSESLRRSCMDQTPFAQDAIAMFAALDALDFPVQDLDRALSMERSYDRSAYLREVLDALRAKCVLVCVPVSQADQIQFEDDRFCPMLVADQSLFVPGRYGVDYAAAAKRIAGAAGALQAQNLKAASFDEQAMRYCLLPVAQDEGMTLHVRLAAGEEIERFSNLLDQFEGVRAVVSVPAEWQRYLIDAAASRVRMLVRLTGADAIPYALQKLGTTRFAAYGAEASLPEIMLGRWIGAKEDIWPILSDAYLPLARAGYELQSAAIERDVNRILCGNLLLWCRPQNG